MKFLLQQQQTLKYIFNKYEKLGNREQKRKKKRFKLFIFRYYDERIKLII